MAPARREVLVLAAAGLEVVGIAIDSASNVGQFTRTVRISYPVLLAEADGLDMMRRLDNSSGGLPYTVFFDRKGAPAHRKLGAVKQADLDAVLGTLTPI